MRVSTRWRVAEGVGRESFEVQEEAEEVVDLGVE